MPLRVTYPTAIVMLAVSRGVRYGFDIMDASGLQSGTVYPILSRLKAEGLVETKWVEGDAGHPRKYYWLTSAGRSRATAMARYASGFLGSISQIIAPLLAKEKK